MRFLTLLFLCFGILSAESLVLKEADRVLGTMQKSYYASKDDVDEQNGVYGLVCSSFVGYLLLKTTPEAYEVLPKHKTQMRPKASHFYDYFANISPKNPSKYWQKIEKMSDVRKGDIIAWKYDKSLGKKSTGHVVLVYDSPTKEAENRYKVRVADSSNSRHANDSRAKGESGIGVGDMWFLTDDSGQAVAIFWSNPNKEPSYYPIAIGRVIENK